MVTKPDIGSIVNVKGTMRATAMVAVNPGSAPAITPMGTAIDIKIRFFRVRTLIRESKIISKLPTSFNKL
jgi:hypothetical protein